MDNEQDYNKRQLLAMAQRCIGGRDLDAVDDYFAEDFYSHVMPDHDPGPEGERQQLRPLFESFSEVEYVYTDLIAVEDRVAARATFRAVHTGEYGGVPPTGIRVESTSVDICRFVDGKIAEHWGCFDDDRVMLQIRAAAGGPR